MFSEKKKEGPVIKGAKGKDQAFIQDEVVDKTKGDAKKVPIPAIVQPAAIQIPPKKRIGY
jgi:hypothetical protein